MRKVLLVSILLTSCAVGYSSRDKAVGIAIGDAEISACEGADIAEPVAAMTGSSVEVVPDCPRVRGGAISITGGGVITSLASFLVGWILK